MPITRSTLVARNPHVAYRALGGDRGGVLLHVETGAYHGVDPVGAMVWETLVDRTTLAELLPRVREQLTDVPARFETEISEFLEQLRDRDLVVIVDPGT